MLSEPETGYPGRAARAALRRLLPFLAWLPQVGRGTLRADLAAGLTGAVIVLPQGVAYATIAGLPPQYGLYTAIVTPIVAGLFGSSRHLVSGPTAAISIVAFSVVSGAVGADSPLFIPYMLLLTFLVGVIQLLLGALRLGELVNFISPTVVVGFTSGAAVLIALSQLEHFFGATLPTGAGYPDVIGNPWPWLGAVNGAAVSTGAITLLSAVLIRRWRPRWPGMLIAMVIGSLFCLAVDGAANGVALVGAMPASLPPLSMPPVSLEATGTLVSGAAAVASIALIEAVAIARGVAARSHQRIDGNQEFIGQGMSNLIGSFFSCYPASGSFTRTGANYDAGARTPLAAVFAALILAGILLVAPGLTAYLPMPAMAGIVLLIAWNLIEWRYLREVIRLSREETVILIVTFGATLVLALEFAIYAGMLLSITLFLRRTARPRMVPIAPVPERQDLPFRNARKRGLGECGRLKIVRVDGSIFFGAVDYIQGELNRLREAGERHVLLDCSGVGIIDVAGAEMLRQEARRMREAGGELYLCGLKDGAAEVLRTQAYVSAIGEGRWFSTPKEAVRQLSASLGIGGCPRCRKDACPLAPVLKGAAPAVGSADRATTRA